MEEFDDVLEKPTDGVLNISNKAWVTIEEEVWSWGASLKSLQASFNSIKIIPPEIGQLNMLRELDLSSNRLKKIPPEIGHCVRLTKLKVNGNRLTKLPNELCQCILLEELYASENMLLEIPKDIDKLNVLKILMLQNNRIDYLPSAVSKCLSLEHIDVRHNPVKNMPEGLLSDANMIRWVCNNLAEFEAEMDVLRQANKSLQDAQIESDEQRVKLRDELSAAKSQIVKMKKNRPKTYMHIKRNFKSCGSRICTIM
eukprot:TRINITY_DN782119_c0_g1_i1.p1 TRINITY_DN782119_c0_g1~~TRINITY_DN782119_c0_g1_i1.p1  ORF type:complete len:255 (-),score=46.79 TRINITY_DN782119_c0_g1_i1:267-1031(-)